MRIEADYVHIQYLGDLVDLVDQCSLFDIGVRGVRRDIAETLVYLIAAPVTASQSIHPEAKSNVTKMKNFTDGTKCAVGGQKINNTFPTAAQHMINNANQN